MRWTDTHLTLAGLSLPPGVTLGQLARPDIPALLAALAGWHPDLAIGEEQQLLRAALYEEESALLGEEDRVAERPLCAFLLRAAGEIVGALVLEHEADGQAICGRLSAVAPAWRGRGLGRALLRVEELCGRALGARLVWGLAELDNLPQCALLEQEGRRLCGVVPDSERRRGAPGVTRFVPEAIYVKTLVAPEAILWPEAAQLTPGTTLLFRHLDLPGAPPHLAGARAGRTTEGEGEGEGEAAGTSDASPTIVAARGDAPAASAADPALPPREEGCWPDIALLGPQAALPPGYRLRALRRDDIPAVIAALPAWFPDLTTGSEAHLLDPAFYDAQVALAGEEQRLAARPAHAFVVVAPAPADDPAGGDALAAVVFTTYDAEGYTLISDCGVIHPRHRKSGLATRLLPIVTLLGRAIGAETVMGWATLRHVAMQAACERAGWRLWGLIPASERYEVAGATRYGFEAVYGVTLVPPALSRWPEDAALPPARAALVRAFR